jgi:hypothetical protein
MKVLITIISIMFTTSLFAQAEGEGWYKQNSHTTAFIPSVFFINKDTGWAGTYDGCFGTINGGDTWELYSLQEVVYPHFIDGKNGIANGDTSLIRSHDGGRTWIPIGTRCPIKGQLQAFGLDTIRIGNDRKTASTIDGGKTWVNPSVPFGGSIHFVSGQIGFRCGDQYLWLGDSPPAKGTNGASFEYTTNGGVNWHARFPFLVGSTSVGVSEDLVSLFSIDTSTMYVAASGIYKSTNSGESWTTVFSENLEHGFFAIHFINKQYGTAVGGLGEIVRTTDSGQTWIFQNSTVTSYLYNVTFIDSLTGWASGEVGTIVHTINGGKSWVRQYLPKPLTTSVSPEPFGRKTSITYELPSAMRVKIRIYDVLGRELEILESPGIQDAGTHTIEFDGSRYPEGTFHYQIQTDGFYGTGKMTKVVY